MQRPLRLALAMASLASFVLPVNLCLADSATGNEFLIPDLPSQLGGPWLGQGVYDLKEGGIRVHVGPNQRFLDLSTTPASVYNHSSCRLAAQALVYDPGRGLMFVGREDSHQKVVNEWDKISLSVVPMMLRSKQELAYSTGGYRLPITDVEWIRQPEYETATHIATWGMRFRSGDKPWTFFHWLRFDQSGYVNVSIISRGVTGEKSLAKLVDATFPLKVETIETHGPPLPGPGEPMDFTVAFLTVMYDPVAFRCAWGTPFGPGF